MLLQLIALILAFSFAITCPPREKLYPCECESSEHTKFIKCAGIENDQDLMNAASSLKGMKDIYSFTIENAVLNYIPHNLFEGIQLVELEFLTSSLMAFTDTDVAFRGLENSLERLLVTDCNFMNTWDWSMLKNMKKLMRLDIVGGDLEAIDDDIRELSSLKMKDISFERNKITYIYDYAFSNFTELQTLSLSKNLIEEVKRTMLPNPASALKYIDLGYNQIRQIPEDFFTNMPSLDSIALSSNKLLTLNEQTFSPVWEQLEDFAAMNNNIRCDCRMSWILKIRMPPNMRAVCDQPMELKGKNLATLTSKDLWC